MEPQFNWAKFRSYASYKVSWDFPYGLSHTAPLALLQGMSLLCHGDGDLGRALGTDLQVAPS